MPTSYSPILKLALPATNELSGSWGDVVNQNITDMVEEAIAGMADISTWAAASHTLTTANGTTSEARCAILDCSGAPGAAAEVICPAVTKLYVLQNRVTGGYAVTLKTSGGTGIAVPDGSAMLLFCDGTNVVSAVSYVAAAGALLSTLGVASGGTGATTLSGILKGNGTSAIGSASAGTDYVTPGAATSSGLTMATAKMLGRSTAGTGAMEEITVGSGLSLSAGSLTATGSGGSVTTVSVATANGFTGTVSNPTTTPAITLTATPTGMLKSNGTALSAATAGTDYLAPPSGTALLKANSGGALANATAGTDYLAPPSGTALLKANSGGALANATANSDYLAPALANTAVSGFKTATFNSQTTIATTTGSITVDWTTAQNQKQTEPTGTITYTFTAPPGPCHLQLLIDSDGTSTAQTINWPGSVIWYGQSLTTTTANKKHLVNFWYDGTSYHAAYMAQV